VFIEGGANVSLITNAGNGFTGGGDVAKKLMANGFNINALRTHDTLRKDEWKLYDKEIVQIAKARLIGVGDLVSRGLTYKLANALGVTRLEWENDTDMTPAAVGMSGIQRSQDDRVEFSMTGIPIPIVYKDFTLNIRHLEASRRSGQPLDTTMAMKAGRSVAEKIEDILWNGFTGLGSNNTIYGYRTALNRNTGSVTSTWVTATGAQILADVLAMLQKAQDDHMYGPYVLYVPIAVMTNLGNDFKAESDKSIMQRLMEVPGITEIKSTAALTGTNIMLVQMTSDVVQMIDGIQPTMVQWDSHGGMVTHFKIIAIMLPRFRNDSENQSGIVHYS
jgi:uncharacterized linocin/CFP29 family protein